MKQYSWQRLITNTIHAGYRVAYEYEVCSDFSNGTSRQYYTGRRRLVYV